MLLRDFYSSKAWSKLRTVIIAERVNNEGDIICEHCGKPIVNKYDCVAHHEQHLTEGNVNNPDIALNSDNIALVHFKCHNEIHNRFNNYQRHIYIVWGSPRAGKKTYVNKVAMCDDLIIDIDRIYNAINNERSSRLLDNVMQIYRVLIDQVNTRNGKWINAFIIRTFPHKNERERLQAQLGAELVYIDTPMNECLKRAKSENEIKIIQDFWKNLQI